MRLSTLFGRTLREAPADAEHPAFQLLLRAGLVRQMLAGGMALLPGGMRVMERIGAIMREELEGIDGQEFRAPVVQAAASWERSGRFFSYGPLMLRVRDRGERQLLVAPTHEETVAELAAREIESYRQLPALIYQIHTKYRDELRPRGGLLRLREFTMLDAYSLSADDAELDTVYDEVAGAFERIFERCGVRWLAVESSSGEMGGRDPREYMALSSLGEDTLALCDGCGYAANLEVAAGVAARADTGPADAALEEVATPDCATIAELAAFMGVPAAATAKAVFFDTPERGLVFAVIRGDLEVNEIKLRAAAGVSELRPASLEQIAAAGAVAGYASPVGLRDVFVLADQSIVAAGPLVAGANRAGFHLRNVVHGRDWQATAIADLATVRAGDGCARCGAALRLERAIEIGHIFKLGTFYSDALAASFLDRQGQAQALVMGSYGIGLERLMQVIVEQHHDAAGIAWPAAVAPFAAQLITLGGSEAVAEAGRAVYGRLRAAGVACLYDDRAERAGVKFNDADLIGAPLRVVVSERLVAAGQLEVKRRGGAAQQIDESALLEWIEAQGANSHA